MGDMGPAEAKTVLRPQFAVLLEIFPHESVETHNCIKLVTAPSVLRSHRLVMIFQQRQDNKYRIPYFWIHPALVNPLQGIRFRLLRHSAFRHPWNLQQTYFNPPKTGHRVCG